MVDGLLQDMNFMKATKINYDPHHIISQRMRQNKNNAFEKQEIKGLADRANLMESHSDVENSENLLANPSAKMKSAVIIIPNP